MKTIAVPVFSNAAITSPEWVSGPWPPSPKIATCGLSVIAFSRLKLSLAARPIRAISAIFGKRWR